MGCRFRAFSGAALQRDRPPVCSVLYTKQTLYEVERRQFTPATYDRAMECLDAVNGEIEAQIHSAWGRG